MKQSDGADFLGANNPHNSNIGIIYVAPNDEGSRYTGTGACKSYRDSISSTITESDLLTEQMNMYRMLIFLFTFSYT
jgi:hypothetical protein